MNNLLTYLLIAAMILIGGYLLTQEASALPRMPDMASK